MNLSQSLDKPEGVTKPHGTFFFWDNENVVDIVDRIVWGIFPCTFPDSTLKLEPHTIAQSNCIQADEKEIKRPKYYTAEQGRLVRAAGT